ncbi:hypothetical protein [Pseudomonas frederiksbergensis]|uniref:Uncharacterized protein n=1 Tax=Pseudomonas frederiksbergensis TaxID=104087 RepID=A0A423KQI2_9PSED|nr:hypothetical protein [Pseudomonas frederiksbergensis]RON57427.1 hypothetical protein BK665_04805 [Pseudomonas frederiksbergensis]
MKPKVKLAVTRILSLQTEFTAAELAEALNFIKAFGLDTMFNTSALEKKKNGESLASKPVGNAPSNIKNGSARILADLETVDHDKFEALSQFEVFLRSGKLLSKLDSIRRVGVSIDKTFQTGKSRKDAIPRLIGLLAKLPLAEAKQVISRVSEEYEDAGMLDEGYQNLANFLLRVKS